MWYVSERVVGVAIATCVQRGPACLLPMSWFWQRMAVRQIPSKLRLSLIRKIALKWSSKLFALFIMANSLA